MDDDLTGLKRIKAARFYLTSQVDIVHDGVADNLFAKGLIGQEEYELITMKRETTQEHMRKLITILLKKAQREEMKGVYATFCQILRDCHYEFVAEKLDEYDVTGVDIEDGDCIDEVDAKFNKLEDKLDRMHADLAERITLTMQLYNKMADKVTFPGRDENSARTVESYETVDAAEHRGVLDTGFVNMLLSSQGKNSETGSAGDNATMPNFIFPNINQLSSTWESLTVCRLSVDLVHHLACNQHTKRQPLKPFSSIAVTMRRLIDQIVGSERFCNVLEHAMNYVKLSDFEDYETFAGIRDELFKFHKPGDQKWSPFLVWFAFCAYFARGFPKWTKSEELDVHGIYCWYVIDQLVIAGEWVSLLYLSC